MIGFESNEVRLRKLRERLQAMSDAELIEFGQELRKIPKRVSGVKDAFDELEKARAEWRRRYSRA